MRKKVAIFGQIFGQKFRGHVGIFDISGVSY